jgi:hypothetical protein
MPSATYPSSFDHPENTCQEEEIMEIPLYSSLIVRDQVSHSYKTAGRVIVLYGLWIADEKTTYM